MTELNDCPYLFRKYLCKTRAPLNHAVSPALQPATRQQNHINHLDSVSNREQHLVQRIYQKNRNPFRLSPLRVISHVRVGIPPDLPKSKTSFSPCHYRHFCYICKNHSTHETPQNRGFVSFGSSTFCNVMRCSTARTQPAPSSASQGGSASPSRTPQTAEAPQKAEKAQRAAGTSALRLRQPPIIRGHARNTIPFVRRILTDRKGFCVLSRPAITAEQTTNLEPESYKT